MMNIFLLENNILVMHPIRIFLGVLEESMVVRLAELVMRIDVDYSSLESLIGRRLPEVRQSTLGW